MIANFLCLWELLEMFSGLISEVVVLGEKHDAFEIAIFRLTGLAEVNFYRLHGLPE
jgi:hypothetical protein